MSGAKKKSVKYEFDKDSGYEGVCDYFSLGYADRISEASRCGVTIDAEFNYSFGDDLMKTIAMMSELVTKQVKSINVKCIASGVTYTDIEELSHSEDAAGFFQAMGLRLIIGNRMGKHSPSK